jgi:regulator of sigma E protease
MIVLKILLFVFILGLIILVHEAGHFFWAKKFHVHIYEFSIGMGPILRNKKGKDGIDYNLRAVPIGGFVAMAGEVYEDDDLKKIPKEDFMCNKPWYQRIIILVAGVVNNFILAIILLFLMSLIWGGTTLKPVVKSVVDNSAMQEAGVTAGDTILKINNYSIKTWDEAQIVLYMKDADGVYDFTIKHSDGSVETYNITPKTVKDEETGKDQKVFGVEIVQEEAKGLFGSIGYAFSKFQSIMNSMSLTIYGLFSGKISMSALSGPVGIYEVIGESVAAGLYYVIYVIAFLSINVGYINILPFPAFDGGRVFFLIIEKIKGSPVNSKFESTCHMVGFCLLILLMLYVTYQDVLRFIIK